MMQRSWFLYSREELQSYRWLNPLGPLRHVFHNLLSACDWDCFSTEHSNWKKTRERNLLLRIWKLMLFYLYRRTFHVWCRHWTEITCSSEIGTLSHLGTRLPACRLQQTHNCRRYWGSQSGLSLGHNALQWCIAVLCMLCRCHPR